ncbi:hypothetical protein RB195_026505 [Necator americanus]|uniref:Calcineurin-like phosphoesterase domain-containing protein n=1 Tax=Necator americanus TaxID=51031 RepID=A0ABR1EX91_NECAM
MVIRQLVFALAVLRFAEMKADPNSEEEYWETIKATKVQLPVQVNSKGEINPPPAVPHLKVVCISDTHNQLDQVKEIPDGDVLIHAGDLTNYGSEEELKKFNDEIGNHDLGFDDTENLKERLEQYRGQGTSRGYLLLTNATWLHDKGVEIDGVNFFGSSWHPLYGYPFYRPRPELEEKWKVLPSNLDVLITHSPALGYLDAFGDERWGCRYLLKEIEERVKPKSFKAASRPLTEHVHSSSLPGTTSLVISTNDMVFYPMDLRVSLVSDHPNLNRTSPKGDLFEKSRKNESKKRECLDREGVFGPHGSVATFSPQEVVITPRRRNAPSPMTSSCIPPLGFARLIGSELPAAIAYS